MTAASLGPGPDFLSTLSIDKSARTRREAFLLSLLGQAGVLALIVYLTTRVISSPEIDRKPLHLADLPLIFSGSNGGGGGDHDPLPASSGAPPKASLDPQIVSPTVKVPTAMPILPVPETVVVAPDVKFPQADRIGDPASPFSQWSSDGQGGPHGIGRGCCDGIGNFIGPHVGSGTPGIYPAGKGGVTTPEAIYSPEPSFSEEARKIKAQGIVLLVLVVGKDGHAYDIHVRQSLGNGLDEKAIEAVNRWRFRPATLNGQPVAAQIAVQVDFHLY